MGVKVREKTKGSGEYWIFINRFGKRRAKKIGRNKRYAGEVAKKIEAKLTLRELNIEQIGMKCPVFRDYAETWLSLPSERKPQTTDNYRAGLKTHIYPVFGKIAVNHIKQKDVKLLFDKLSVKGLSTGSINLVKIPLKMIFNHAVESELIQINPVDRITLKRKWINPDRFNPLTESEAFAFLDQAKVYRDGIFYPPLLCSLRTGLRFGELVCLTWNDIDFESRQISVTKTYRKRYGYQYA